MQTCENCGRPATMQKKTGAGWAPTCDRCKPGDWTGEARALVAPAVDTSSRLALSKQEAAATLGVSVDYLDKHIMPEIRTITKSGRVLIAKAELDKWVEKSSGRHLD